VLLQRKGTRAQTIESIPLAMVVAVVVVAAAEEDNLRNFGLLSYSISERLSLLPTYLCYSV
jgi:hypothetical protein